jgi:GntR family transcriptional regulator, colanic acid and biofilm gene transcriptional regulator
MSSRFADTAAQSSKVEPLDQGNLSARSYISLRAALLDGKFRPGERLIMKELATMLGTSVTPIRESCLRLVSEQALELRSGRFVTVPDLTLASYVEIRTIRIALEGLAAELAAPQIPLETVSVLEGHHQRYTTAEKNRDSAVAITANREFHFGVYAAAGLNMLMAQIEMLWVCMGPILAVYYKDMSAKFVGGQEHVRLIKALKKRDGKMAREAIQKDILLGSETIVPYVMAQDKAARGEN